MMSFANDAAYASIPQTAARQEQYAATTPYPYNAAFFDGLSHQLTTFATTPTTIQRRHSRSSHYGTASSRIPGSAMRVVKPRSANNSPQAVATLQARTRSYLYQQQQLLQLHQLQQQQQQHQVFQQHDVAATLTPARTPVSNRRQRPVSWHPGNTYRLPTQQVSMPAQVPVQMMQAPVFLSTHFQSPMYATPSVTTPSTTAADNDALSSMQPFSLSPAAYSSHTSPSTAFSPYVGHPGNGASNYYSPNPWAVSPSTDAKGVFFDKLPSPVLAVDQQQQLQQLQQLPQTNMAAPPPLVYQQQSTAAPQCFAHTGLVTNPVSSTLAHWAGYPANGYSSAAVPTTPPDNVVGMVYTAPEPAKACVPSDDDLAAYQKPELEQEPEEAEGELLVGMGLYDPPEMDRYPSFSAQLLGVTYPFPEPTGRGLKLEDAWELPESLNNDDDGNETEDEPMDAEGDADGEDEQC